MQRAVDALRRTQAGVIEASEYRRLFNFLTSLLFMLGRDDTLMHFMAQPLRGDGELAQGPGTRVKPSKEMQQSLTRWVEKLLNLAGASLIAGVRVQAEVSETPTWRTTSDAAVEPANASGVHGDGLGGALAHKWWHWPLCARLRALPISALELMAFFINLVVFDPDLEGAQRVSCACIVHTLCAHCMLEHVPRR